jgi:hypothetical protein
MSTAAPLSTAADHAPASLVRLMLALTTAHSALTL